MPPKPQKPAEDKSKNPDKSGAVDSIDSEIQRKLAETEKARAEKAKKLAAEIAKQTGHGSGSGSKNEPPKEDPALAILTNMCGILNNGFNRLGSDMKCYNNTISSELKEMKSSFENTLEQMFYEEEEEESDNLPDTAETNLPGDVMSDAGSEISPEVEIVKQASDGNTEDTPTESNSIFSKMRKKLVVPKNVGPEVDEDLAKFINFISKEPMKTEEFLSIKKTILRPQNCTQLQVPSIPEPVWKTIGENAQTNEKYLQRVHGDTLTFVYSMIYAINGLNLVPQCPSLACKVEEFTECLKLFGYIHRSGFIEHRREVLRPVLPGDYKRLAGPNFPPSPESLLGPDLQDSIKTIKEVLVLSNKMKESQRPSTSSHNNRYTPYRGRARGFRRGRGVNRGRGRGWRTSDNQAKQDSNQEHQNPNRSQGFRGRGVAHNNK